MIKNNILHSPLPDLVIPACNVLETLWDRFMTFGDKPALTEISSDHEGPTMTYSDLCRSVDLLAFHLSKLGIQQGSVMGVACPNHVEVVVVVIALWRLGAVSCMIDPLATEGEMKKYLRLAGCTSLFVHESAASVAEAVAEKVQLKTIISRRPSGDLISYKDLQIPLSYKSPDLVKLDGTKHPAFIMFSSGTSGFPKAVMIPHSAVSYSLKWTQLGGAIADIKTSTIFQPLWHIFGLLKTLNDLHLGRSIVLLTRFHLETYLSNVVKEQEKELILVPPVAVMLAKGGEKMKHDLKHVIAIKSGAAPLLPETRNQLKELFGEQVLVQTAYGLTETFIVTASYPGDRQDDPPNSVGRVTPNRKVKIVDTTTGEIHGPRGTGEILVKGPGLMLGYCGNQQATRQDIDKDGWFHTGDLGYYDENGYLYLVGRMKEMIKYKAHQISPSELDSILVSHPLVSDAAVVGVKDELAGELPRAWIVKKPGSSLTERDIIQFVSEKVSPYKRLHGGVKFVSHIPKTQTGKVLRRQMKEDNSKL